MKFTTSLKLPFTIIIVGSILVISWIIIFPDRNIKSRVRTPNAEESIQGIFDIRLESEPVNIPAKADNRTYNTIDIYTTLKPLTFERDTWITSIKTEVVGAATETLHHAALYYDNLKGEYCVNSKKFFYAISKESIDFYAPTGLGQFIPKGTTIRSSGGFIHFRNDTYNNYENVKFIISITGSTNSTENIISLDTFWLTIECLATEELIFPVPPGNNFSIMLEKPYVAKEDFLIHVLAAHIHDYGQKLEITVNGEIIYTFIPELDGSKITKMPYYLPSKPISINKGDIIQIEAFYNNTSSNIVEGMGSSLN